MDFSCMLICNYFSKTLRYIKFLKNMQYRWSHTVYLYDLFLNQVIFHAVEQLKLLQAEEILQLELATSSSLPTTQSMKDQQSQSTTPEGIFIISTATTAKVHDKKTETPMMSTSTLTSEISSQGSSTTYEPTEVAQRLATSIASVVSDNGHRETPEVNEETTEKNYELSATPETNHESPEPVQEIPESNQEVPEKSEEKFLNTERSIDAISTQSQTPQYNVTRQQSTQASVTQVSDDQKKKKPTVDSVVDEIYGIVKTTTSLFSEESDDADESKSVETSIEKSEKIEEEEEETRW